jgi:hypothetical protein
VTEQAQLLLLKGKLNKIRRDKRNMTILGTVISVIFWLIVELYWRDFLTTATIVFLIVGITLYLTVIRRYNAKEAQLIWQIQRLTRKSSPDNKFQIVDLAKNGSYERDISTLYGCNSHMCTISIGIHPESIGSEYKPCPKRNIYLC